VVLVHAAAERTPFEAASFDLVFCDHGAMSFASPERTIPEVARILRPGGILAFSVEHPLHAVAWDDALDGPSRRFARPYFELDRVALLFAHGFALEKLLEPRPNADATTSYARFAGLEWARDFPAELLVRARKRADPSLTPGR
jgi:SAM-dependent methyltransferase